MRVATERWGEVTIKKQGDRKNKFNGTKSFSIDSSSNEYNIEQFKDIFKIMVNLTEDYTYKELKLQLKDLQKHKNRENKNI
ncbi:MAG: hypothetical protein KO464_06535 [Candidatus Methanofastidiosum sp.]|jgi:hypothetical protein|nr:hypothetical protein [Methanofastidiosum sp.]